MNGTGSDENHPFNYGLPAHSKKYNDFELLSRLVPSKYRNARLSGTEELWHKLSEWRSGEWMHEQTNGLVKRWMYIRMNEWVNQ